MNKITISQKISTESNENSAAFQNCTRQIRKRALWNIRTHNVCTRGTFLILQNIHHTQLRLQQHLLRIVV